MKNVIPILILLILSQVTGCTYLPRIYLGSGEMRGRVIDAETTTPVQDAVVVAIWKLYGYGFHEKQYTANIAVLETTTDENGDFVLAAWGPRFGMSGFMDDKHSSPLLIVYKKGYLFTEISSWRDEWPWHSPYPPFYKSDFITVEMRHPALVGMPVTSSISGVHFSSGTYVEDYINDSRGKLCDWLDVPLFTTRLVETGEMSVKSLKQDAGNCWVSEKYIDNMIRRYRQEE
jgi:hypothetical protein